MPPSSRTQKRPAPVPEADEPPSPASSPRPPVASSSRTQTVQKKQRKRKTMPPSLPQASDDEEILQIHEAYFRRPRRVSRPSAKISSSGHMRLAFPT
ncbi:hypothetical protein B9479_008210, partial [Cryptococcus floricola]